LVTALLAGVIAIDGSTLIGRKFPGFLLSPTRLVSLVSLPEWPDTWTAWRQRVVAVDNRPAVDSAAVFGLIRDKELGQHVTYTLLTPNGEATEIVAAVRQFTHSDYVVLFGGLIANGLAWIVISLVVWWRKPESSAAHAFLVVGISLGLLAITSVSSVSDGPLLRLQLLAQTLGGAGLIHLALVFPNDRLSRLRAPGLFAIYLPFLALAVVYQLVWPDPEVTVLTHTVVTASIAGGALLLVLSLLWPLLARQPILVRRRAALVLLSALGAGAVALFWGALVGFGAKIAVAAIVMSSFLGALALGFAIVSDDFFAVDNMLRRLVAYVIAIPMVAAAYLGATMLLQQLLGGTEYTFKATPFFTVINLVLLFLLGPLVQRVRQILDGIFSPQGYESERGLSNLNRGLGSARTTQTLVANTLDVLKRTISPSKAMVFLRARGAGFPLYSYDDPAQRKFSVPEELADRLESGENAVRYQWDDGSGRPIPPLWDRLQAELLVPMYRSGSCVGVIALSAKDSGHAYETRDISFVRTAANSIALALPNAAAQDKLDVLHKHLEDLSESLRSQTNRTEALRAMNTELGDALQKLRNTHQQLMQNQQSVLRAERLAALSRLSTGLTQEISGPLNTVINSLNGVARIGREFTASPANTSEQRAAFESMLSHAETGAAWIERTIAYLRGFRGLGRGVLRDSSETFALRDAVSDVMALVRLRIREAGCTLAFGEEPEGIMLTGSRQRFALVLVDLITSAAQAYDESDVENGRIEIEAEMTSAGVSVRVIDWAGGVPAASLPRIFEQLGNEGVPGNRRGLWMAKNLVEEGFGGAIEADTNDDRTCFSAQFPSLASGLSKAVND
jgi:signal transduction histidine kinase